MTNFGSSRKRWAVSCWIKAREHRLRARAAVSPGVFVHPAATVEDM